MPYHGWHIISYLFSYERSCLLRAILIFHYKWNIYFPHFESVSFFFFPISKYMLLGDQLSICPNNFLNSLSLQMAFHHSWCQLPERWIRNFAVLYKQLKSENTFSIPAYILKYDMSFKISFFMQVQSFKISCNLLHVVKSTSICISILSMLFIYNLQRWCKLHITFTTHHQGWWYTRWWLPNILI